MQYFINHNKFDFIHRGVKQQAFSLQMLNLFYNNEGYNINLRNEV